MGQFYKIINIPFKKLPVDKMCVFAPGTYECINHWVVTYGAQFVLSFTEGAKSKSYKKKFWGNWMFIKHILNQLFPLIFWSELYDPLLNMIVWLRPKDVWNEIYQLLSLNRFNLWFLQWSPLILNLLRFEAIIEGANWT